MRCLPRHLPNIICCGYAGSVPPPLPAPTTLVAVRRTAGGCPFSGAAGGAGTGAASPPVDGRKCSQFDQQSFHFLRDHCFPSAPRISLVPFCPLLISQVLSEQVLVDTVDHVNPLVDIILVVRILASTIVGVGVLLNKIRHGNARPLIRSHQFKQLFYGVVRRPMVCRLLTLTSEIWHQSDSDLDSRYQASKQKVKQ